MNNTKHTLAENVRAAREALNWTQQDLAFESGLSIATIRTIEQERSAASVDTLDQLAEALRTTPAQLITAK